MRRDIGILVLAATLVAIGTVGYIAFSKARRAAEYSAQMALLSKVKTELAAYHGKHGEYPRSLSELGISYFPDGSSPETIRSFDYISYGTSFTLYCTTALSGVAVTVERQGAQAESKPNQSVEQR